MYQEILAARGQRMASTFARGMVEGGGFVTYRLESGHLDREILLRNMLPFWDGICGCELRCEQSIFDPAVYQQLHYLGPGLLNNRCNSQFCQILHV